MPCRGRSRKSAEGHVTEQTVLPNLKVSIHRPRIDSGVDRQIAFSESISALLVQRGGAGAPPAMWWLAESVGAGNLELPLSVDGICSVRYCWRVSRLYDRRFRTN